MTMQASHVNVHPQTPNTTQYFAPRDSVPTAFGGWRTAHLEMMVVIRAYARAAASRAVVEEIEPNQWFADVKELAGVWGEGDTKDAAIANFEQSVVAWVEVKSKRGVAVPSLDGIILNLSQSA